MKLHRAAILALMILASLVLLVAMTADGLAAFNRGSLAALLVVVGGAAVAGIAFSYRRYFPRR